ncbi:hypothetical protein ABEB36_012557 [Hypothenemus hampei]|uniref:Fatty acyl-CoA reductase n=1 Tax=Hypothenemus hampei TaxID=57062 RepID=A0ABD1EBS5_HYPHA
MSVIEFYKGKNVLLTGGTGYFGKMIIEKLLRTTEVANIYLIVRPKRDIVFDKRVTKMFEEQISFKVNIVFHCGASLNMDSSLIDAVKTNVNGTAEILEIMKGAKKLLAFVLVSTAYSNCLHQVIEEAFYDPPINPKLLIAIVEGTKPEVLENISKGVIGKWPNTYSFTKAVSEHLLISDGVNMPVGLFRPTIVTSTISEPLAGWADNLYGPLGILVSSNCGILRVIRGNPKIRADTVPGDMVINGLLCYAWDIASQWSKNPEKYSPRVINFSGNSSPLYLTIREYTSMAENSGYIPFKKTIWCPMLYIVDNKCIFKTLQFLLHTTPAYLYDFLLICLGRKPQMRKIYSKLDKVMSVLHYFLIQEWTIKNENLKALWEKLGPNDRITYNFDFTAVEAETYLKNLMIGLKKYTLKEDMSKSQFHKTRYQRLRVLHNVLKYICMYFIGYRTLQRLFYLMQIWLSKLRRHYRCYS